MCILQAKSETEKHEKVNVDHVIHIGDTPGDVIAALDAKADVFGVLTGNYRRNEFQLKAKIVPNLERGFSPILDLIIKLQEN